MNSKQIESGLSRQGSQPAKFPGAAPTSSIEQALGASRTELRAVERLLLSSDRCSPAGLLVAQLRFDLVRLESGMALTRGDVLSLLATACKISAQVEE